MGQWMRLAVSPLKLGISQSQHEASAFNGKAVLSTLAQPVHKAQPQPFYLYISSKKAMKSLIFGPNLSIKTALLEFYPISSWISPILANPLRPGLAFSKQCHQSRSWAKSWPRLCFRITFLMIPGDFCPHDFKRNGSNIFYTDMKHVHLWRLLYFLEVLPICCQMSSHDPSSERLSWQMWEDLNQRNFIPCPMSKSTAKMILSVCWCIREC